MDGFTLSPQKCSDPRLFLTGRGLSLAQADAQNKVEAENHAAASLASGGPEREADVREIFALRTAQMLEGGRAAILQVDRRRLLVDAAGRAGMRPFEANLIIAIVQDGARRGRGAAREETSSLLRLIPEPRAAWWRSGAWEKVLPVLAAVVLGAVLLVVMIEWVMRG